MVTHDKMVVLRSAHQASLPRKPSALEFGVSGAISLLRSIHTNVSNLFLRVIVTLLFHDGFGDNSIPE